MVAPVYADADALAAWLGDDQTVPAAWDQTRVLERASRVVDRLITGVYAIDGDEQPTDDDVAAAMSEATCAVVEYWIAAGGEDVDRVILGGPIIFDGATITFPPTWVSPRASEILRAAGLRGEPGPA